MVEHLLCKQEVRGSIPLDSIVQEDEKSDVSDSGSIPDTSILGGAWFRRSIKVLSVDGTSP